MYSIGEIVLYGVNGVCRINDITVQKIGKIRMEYYELKPLYSNISTLLVPTGNETLVGKMRYLCSTEKINSILNSVDSCELEWIDNKVDRIAAFKEIIARADCGELVGLVRLLYGRERRIAKRGKRLPISDERILKEAKRMVCDEISTVLNVERDSVMPLITK